MLQACRWGALVTGVTYGFLRYGEWHIKMGRENTTLGVMNLKYNYKLSICKYSQQYYASFLLKKNFFWI